MQQDEGIYKKEMRDISFHCGENWVQWGMRREEIQVFGLSISEGRALWKDLAH